MIKSISTIFLFISTFQLFSQSDEIKWGASVGKLMPLCVYTDTLNKETYWLVLESKETRYLEKFDSTGNKIFSTQLISKTPEGIDIKVFNLWRFGRNLLALGLFNDRKSKETRLFTYSISMNGSTNSDVKKIFRGVIKEGILMTVSPNSSLLTIGTRKKESNKSDLLTFLTFDSTLTALNTKTFHVSNDLIIEHIELNNDGSILLQSREKNKDIRLFHLWFFSKNSLEPQELKIEVGNKIIQSMSFKKGLHNEFIIAGFCHEPNDNDNTSFKGSSVFERPHTGLFHARLYENQSVLSNLRLISFSPDTDILPKETFESIDNILHVHIRKNGGFSLLEEKYYDTPYSKYFHYGNILITEIDSEGNIRYTKSLLKDQSSFYYSLHVDWDQSYLLLNNDGSKEVSIIINENERSVSSKTVIVKPNLRNSVPVVYSFDKNGNFNSTPITLKNEGITILPSYSFQISSKRAVLLGIKREGKELLIGSLKLKD